MLVDSDRVRESGKGGKYDLIGSPLGLIGTLAFPLWLCHISLCFLERPGYKKDRIYSLSPNSYAPRKSCLRRMISIADVVIARLRSLAKLVISPAWVNRRLGKTVAVCFQRTSRVLRWGRGPNAEICALGTGRLEGNERTLQLPL
jgi:hypothetical protein